MQLNKTTTTLVIQAIKDQIVAIKAQIEALQTQEADLFADLLALEGGGSAAHIQTEKTSYNNQSPKPANDPNDQYGEESFSARKINFAYEIPAKYSATGSVRSKVIYVLSKSKQPLTSTEIIEKIFVHEPALAKKPEIRKTISTIISQSLDKVFKRITNIEGGKPKYELIK